MSTALAEVAGDSSPAEATDEPTKPVEDVESKTVVQLPLFEKQRITKFTVNFGGNIEIGDLDLINALKLNQNAELVIKVNVASRGHKRQRDGEGNVTGTVSSSNLVVESIRLAGTPD